MYLWKCWRDTRWFLFVFLAIAALPMPMAAFASHGGVAQYAGSLAFQNTFVTIVAVVNLLVGWRVLAHYGVRAFTEVAAQDVSPRNFVEAVVYACFAYALTFALTAILRNGLKGLGASLGMTVGMVGVAAALQMRWKLDLPLPPQQIGHLPIAFSECVWVIVALLFVCVAQAVVERAEI